MELPPPHVLAQLDAIIVGQARESDSNYQNVGDDVPKKRKANGHGWRSQKRRREESAAATPSQRARRDAEQLTDAAMEC